MKQILSAIPIEIICALISGGVSWVVAAHKARKEFRKLKLIWNREDMVIFNEKFASMAYTTTRYMKHGSESAWKEAVAQISEVRSLVDEDLAPALDSLYFAVSRKDIAAVDTELSKVISKKREVYKKKSSKTAG